MKPTFRNLYIVTFICLIPVMYLIIQKVNTKNIHDEYLKMLDKQIVYVEHEIDTTDGIHLDVVPDTELWEE